MNSDKAYVKKVEEVNEEDIYDMLQQIEESNKEIESSRWNNNIYMMVKKIEEYKESKKRALKRLLALIAATTVFIGASKGYISLSKKVLNNTLQDVKCVTLAYNEENGYSKNEKWVPVSKAEEGTYIKVYEPWNMKREREVKTYEISSLSDMELEEYLKLNLEEMGIDYTSTMENLSGSDVLLNQEEVREVVKKIIYSDQTKVDTSYSLATVLIYVLIILAIIYVDVGLLDAESYCFVLGNLGCLIDCVDAAKYDKEEINYRCSIKMLENICHITDTIKENNELRDKFVEEFNKLKCSDPSEIMEKYRALCKEVDIDKFEKENSLILKELKKRGIDGKQ